MATRLVFVQKLESEGIEIEFGPRHFENLGLWVAFFTDASGALIEVTQGLDW